MRKSAPAKKLQPKKRAPNGVLSRTPVALRLYPDELDRLKKGSHREQRTDAAFARLCFLYGLAAYEKGKALTV